MSIAGAHARAFIGTIGLNRTLLPIGNGEDEFFKDGARLDHFYRPGISNRTNRLAISPVEACTDQSSVFFTASLMDRG